MNARKSIEDMKQCPSAPTMEIDHALQGQEAALGDCPPDHAVNRQDEWHEDPIDVDLAVVPQRLADLLFGRSGVGQAGIVDR